MLDATDSIDKLQAASHRPSHCLVFIYYGFIVINKNACYYHLKSSDQWRVNNIIAAHLGAPSSYSDMAATYEQWGPAAAAAAASTLSYYPSQPGSSYAAAYHLPGTSEYGDQQQVPVYGDAMNQTYVREILSADAFYCLHVCF